MLEVAHLSLHTLNRYASCGSRRRTIPLIATERLFWPACILAGPFFLPERSSRHQGTTTMLEIRDVMERHYSARPAAGHVRRRSAEAGHSAAAMGVRLAGSS